jgi:hypothetical protein
MVTDLRAMTFFFHKHAIRPLPRHWKSLTAAFGSKTAKADIPLSGFRIHPAHGWKWVGSCRF